MKKKVEGWTIVAVEQSPTSSMLEAYTFPKKVILVLGSEQDGIPGNVLELVDDCVEVPQLGTIGSLNVHVCASLVIWEYTKQYGLK